MRPWLGLALLGAALFVAGILLGAIGASGSRPAEFFGAVFVVVGLGGAGVRAVLRP